MRLGCPCAVSAGRCAQRSARVGGKRRSDGTLAAHSAERSEPGHSGGRGAPPSGSAQRLQCRSSRLRIVVVVVVVVVVVARSPRSRAGGRSSGGSWCSDSGVGTAAWVGGAARRERAHVLPRPRKPHHFVAAPGGRGAPGAQITNAIETQIANGRFSRAFFLCPRYKSQRRVSCFRTYNAQCKHCVCFFKTKCASVISDQ